MRKILFRGKCTNNGEWVQGYPCRYGWIGKEKDYIIPDYASALYTAEVDPETIGQYTGLKDMNGNKIFEGDLCLCNRNISKRIDKRIFEIKFDNDNGGFLGESGALRIYPEVFYMCEIVGNIYDNPELMRGVANG